MENTQSRSAIMDHKDLYLELLNEFRLLHLIYHRNKNQHRVSIWWKQLNMLKRNSAQVLELLSKNHNRSLKNQNDIRRLYRIIHDFISKHLHKAYYDFNGVITLGQFVTLGVVLVGLLSKTYSIYVKIIDRYKITFDKLGCIGKNIIRKKQFIMEEAYETQAIIETMNDEEIGQEIIDIPEERTLSLEKSVQTYSIPGLKQSKVKKKKKAKKNKSAIDSIFG